MKRCPECRRDYYDDTLLYCLEDGNALVQGSVPSSDEPATAILSEPGAIATGFRGDEGQTAAFINTTDQTAILPRRAEAEPQKSLGEATEKRSFSANRAAKPLIAGGILVVLLVGGFFGNRYFNSPGKQIESIAVMPFVNESGNGDIEYLSDGMTETLIKNLSNLPNLNVKPRSSVFRYKGKDTDLQTIAKELNVQAILNGRVSQRGEQLTLSLELVDAQKDSVIWSEQYNRKQSDLVSLQSEVARDVSSNLKAKLSGSEAAKIEKTYTTNPEAYQLYLKGRYQWNKRTSESLKQAAEFFDQAIAIDPNYALAYSGLAETYVLCPNYSVAAPMECMPKAKAAALRAIELDDTLAETHVALGIYYSNFAWNLPASEKEFRRAIELNPNYATAHQQFGIECLSVMRRFDEAIAEGKRAEELDPASLIIGTDLGNSFLRARRFDESIAQLTRVLALDQNFWVTYWYLGQAYHGNGQYVEAAATYRKGLTLSDNPFLKALLIKSLSKLDERAEAAKLLKDLEADAERRYVSNSALALAYGSLGEKDKAFAFLEKEVADRASRPIVFSISLVWDDFRDDPRFAEILRKAEQAKMD